MTHDQILRFLEPKAPDTDIVFAGLLREKPVLWPMQQAETQNGTKNTPLNLAIDNGAAPSILTMLIEHLPKSNLRTVVNGALERAIQCAIGNFKRTKYLDTRIIQVLLDLGAEPNPASGDVRLIQRLNRFAVGNSHKVLYKLLQYPYNEFREVLRIRNLSPDDNAFWERLASIFHEKGQVLCMPRLGYNQMLDFALSKDMPSQVIELLVNTFKQQLPNIRLNSLAYSGPLAAAIQSYRDSNDKANVIRSIELLLWNGASVFEPTRDGNSVLQQIIDLGLEEVLTVVKHVGYKRLSISIETLTGLDGKDPTVLGVLQAAQERAEKEMKEKEQIFSVVERFSLTPFPLDTIDGLLYLGMDHEVFQKLISWGAKLPRPNSMGDLVFDWQHKDDTVGHHPESWIGQISTYQAGCLDDVFRYAALYDILLARKFIEEGFVCQKPFQILYDIVVLEPSEGLDAGLEILEWLLQQKDDSGTAVFCWEALTSKQLSYDAVQYHPLNLPIRKERPEHLKMLLKHTQQQEVDIAERTNEMNRILQYAAGRAIINRQQTGGRYVDLGCITIILQNGASDPELEYALDSLNAVVQRLIQM